MREMREDYITDLQGRRVRSKHMARYGEGSAQIPLWADIRTATRKLENTWRSPSSSDVSKFWAIVGS